MSARHSHRWLAWLLPLFLLRAFIPVGFMLSWSDQGLQLVMCSGSGPLPMPVQGDVPAVAAQQHQHHENAHPDSGQHEHSTAHNTAMCPFAAAGMSAAPPSFDAVVAFVATIADEVRGLPAPEFLSAAVLIDRIRGPPLT